MALPSDMTPTGPGVVELASGVDALYMSGRADLPAAVVSALEARRTVAAECGGAAPLRLVDEEFGVRLTVSVSIGTASITGRLTSE